MAKIIGYNENSSSNLDITNDLVYRPPVEGVGLDYSINCVYHFQCRDRHTVICKQCKHYPNTGKSFFELKEK